MDYDEKNVDTFGDDCLDDSCDWAIGHQEFVKLKQANKGSETNFQLEEEPFEFLQNSITQFVLDEDDEEENFVRPSRSSNRTISESELFPEQSCLFRPPTPPMPVEFDEYGSPSTSSIWARDRDNDVATKLKNMFGISSFSAEQKSQNQHVLTLEELEKDILSNSAPISTASRTSKIQPIGTPPSFAGFPILTKANDFDNCSTASSSFPPNPLNRVSNNHRHYNDHSHKHHSQNHYPQRRHYPREFVSHGDRSFPDRQHRSHNRRDGRNNDIDSKRQIREREPLVKAFMTQKEIDWIIKVQSIQIQMANPSVEDYYYLMWKSRKSSSNNLKKESFSSSEEDIIQSDIKLSEIQDESKEYQPKQFDNALGKIALGSIYNPRHIVDVSNRSPDSASHVIPLEGKKFKEHLLFIEKAFDLVIECDSLRKKISTVAEEDRDGCIERRQKLISQLHTSIIPSDGNDDVVKIILSLKKGRDLLARAFPLFSKEHQLECLGSALRQLPVILRKERREECFPLFKCFWNVYSFISSRDLLEFLAYVLSTPAWTTSEFANSSALLICTHLAYTCSSNLISKFFTLLREMDRALKSSKQPLTVYPNSNASALYNFKCCLSGPQVSLFNEITNSFIAV